MNIRYTSDAEDIIREGTEWLLERIKELEAEKEADQDTIAAYKEENESQASEIHDLKKQVEDLESRLENIATMGHE